MPKAPAQARTAATHAWRLSRALESYVSLNEVLGDLTEEDVFAALETESRALRRPSIINRLIGRAVRLNEIRYADQLKERFMAHTPSKVMNAVVEDAPKAAKAAKKTPAKKAVAKKAPAKKAAAKKVAAKAKAK